MKLVPAARVNVIYSERMNPMKAKPRLSIRLGCIMNAKANPKFNLGGEAEVSVEKVSA